MADINHVVLVGRLTRDAQLKYTNSGLAISTFAVAINRRVKQGDRWTDEAHFFDITLFGKQAEAVNQYLRKGNQVAIEGELRQDRWEQDGQRRSKIVIVANNIQLLGSRPSGSMDREVPPVEGNGPIVEHDSMGTFEDDIPF
ncbi:MAG: hypothetical protein Kow009_03740 [Spirochaetales bacterium]